MTNIQLIETAKEAMQKAYSPYSEFCVGAALLTSDGEVFCGCNVENSSFSATCCAERSALFAAVSNGKQSFSAIAIAGGHKGKIEKACVPCGVCRQALAEFCDKDFRILLATEDSYEEHTLGELLPLAFKL